MSKSNKLEKAKIQRDITFENMKNEELNGTDTKKWEEAVNKFVEARNLVKELEYEAEKLDKNVGYEPKYNGLFPEKFGL